MSIDDLVFYIGMTKQPVTRFFEHYHGVDSPIYEITRYLFANGNVCNMSIIDYCNDKLMALQMEFNYIECYSQYLFLINNITGTIMGNRHPLYYQLPKIVSLKCARLLAPYKADIIRQLSEIK